MSLILAIALLAQAPDEGMQTTNPPTAAEVARLELGFTFAVEDSIAREPGTRAPEAYRNLFRLLGCDSWRGREDATSRLESAVRRDPSALRWVFWARRDRDLEVAARANGIIRRAAVCPSCRGSGRSKSAWRGECGDCHAWDGDGYARIPIWIYGAFD